MHPIHSEIADSPAGQFQSAQRIQQSFVTTAEEEGPALAGGADAAAHPL
jgi:hypothetical protein